MAFCAYKSGSNYVQHGSTSFPNCVDSHYNVLTNAELATEKLLSDFSPEQINGLVDLLNNQSQSGIFGLPPLSMEDGLVISAGIVSAWALSFCFGILIRMLLKR